jgi:hypothetical protein
LLSVGIFKKSSKSIQQCVLVALQEDGTVAVAHSKSPELAAHVFTREEWEAFVAGVKNDEFDYPNVGRDRTPA